jgi:hypothetical protein
MKKFTLSALGLTLALGAISPAIAQTDPSTSSMGTTATEKPLMGKVVTEGQPGVVVQFGNNREKTYALDPATVTALKLDSSSTVMLNNHKLGTITNANRQILTVQFADGEEKPYFITQEGRKTLGYGDEVVVTPSQRLVLADNYMLTAADVYVSPSMMASTSMGQPMTSSPTMTPSMSGSTVPTVKPAPRIKPAPVKPGSSTLQNVESAPAMSKPMSPTEPRTDRVPVTGSPKMTDDAPASSKPMSPTDPTNAAPGTPSAPKASGDAPAPFNPTPGTTNQNK